MVGQTVGLSAVRLQRTSDSEEREGWEGKERKKFDQQSFVENFPRILQLIPTLVPGQVRLVSVDLQLDGKGARRYE
jgi:hypothetical protein